MRIFKQEFLKKIYIKWRKTSHTAWKKTPYLGHAAFRGKRHWPKKFPHRKNSTMYVVHFIFARWLQAKNGRINTTKNLWILACIQISYVLCFSCIFPLLITRCTCGFPGLYYKPLCSFAVLRVSDYTVTLNTILFEESHPLQPLPHLFLFCEIYLKKYIIKIYLWLRFVALMISKVMFTWQM